MSLKYKVSQLIHMVKNTKFIVLLLFCFLACAKEEAIPINIDFNVEVIDNDFSVPVRVRINNTTVGAEEYLWTFNNGNPSTSVDKNPGVIVYTTPGDYVIKLLASNQDEIEETKEVAIAIKAEVIIDFSTEIIDSNFPPMEVKLTNTSLGATTYNWMFENGIPTNATAQHPENIIFNTPGEHTITLNISNGLETYQKQETLTVAPNLEAIFDTQVAFEDDDYQAPVTITMINNSISATDYTWTFTGGNPSISTEENPTVTFNTPGEYILQLEATNGKETKIVTKNITVTQNTNLRTFNNINLGINTSHSNNVIGAFFSTTTRQVYKKEDVSEENGALIDLVYFGFNQNFDTNKFISPNQAQMLTFNTIPNATQTKFINKQESCNCTASLSVSQFDAMTDDTELANLTITETMGGLQEFDNTVVPRIVLFETQDGRKGAIKIKNFVADGQNSYIETDIKIQKE